MMVVTMMVVQNMTTFPFRVVDEINQGMDARNERKMFEQIVRAASREDVPQVQPCTCRCCCRRIL